MEEADKQAIVAQYKAGRYNLDICEQFNISKQTLYAILEEYNVPRKIIKGSYTKKKYQMQGLR